MNTSSAPLVDRLIALIEQHYVMPERIARIHAALREHDQSIVMERDDTVVRGLNETLLAGSRDRHLRVTSRPPTTEAAHATDWEQRMQREGVENAGGIAAVTRLQGSVTVITIKPYLSTVASAAAHIEAAFTLAAGAEHVVIDVRAGRGGTPETVALICGYLLGDDSVHLQDVVERDGSRRQFWTTPAIRRLPPGVRVSVLTSSQTFSGCEELAYDLQSLGRAVVVGETTLGGAHPVAAFHLTDTLQINIPVARSVNAVTSTNWEGTGVAPDVHCSAVDALTVAMEIGAADRASQGATS